MSTYLASSEPKHKTGPFTAFTATSKYLSQGYSAVASNAYPRVTMDGDPFFPNLTKLRMAINRLSFCAYPLKLNANTNIIEGGYKTKEPHFRPLTIDDFIIEAHLYVPHPSIVIVDNAYAGKTTPAQVLGI